MLGGWTHRWRISPARSSWVAACAISPPGVAASKRSSSRALPTRLRACGVPVGEALSEADRELYRLLDERDGTGAHSAYNALTRRLVSSMHAAERHAP